MSTAEPMPALTAEIAALPSGFEALYTDHYDFLWRCALRLGVTQADVDDVVQETFVVALRRYDRASFEGPGAARPTTWLFAILHNVLRNHARAERRRQARLELLAADEPPRSSMQAEASLGLCLLDEFLTELEPDRRVVFVLAELEGMRGPEIARALGVNANTVRSRLRAARHAFEDRFGSEAEQLVERASNLEAPPEVRASGLALLGLPLAWMVTKGALGALLGVRGLLGLAIGSVALLGVVVVASADSEPPAAKMVESSTALGPMAGPRPIEPSEAATVPIEIVANAPTARSAVQRSSAAPEATPRDLEAEAREQLARARRALLDGDATAALALVEAPDNWPATLEAHRVALEIGALCTLDRGEQARARAQAWQLEHPESSTAISMRAACWDANSSSVGGHSGP
jgi:RNA polymerase sigma factor (sigma-70 family)